MFNSGKSGYTYIMSNKTRSVLYIGVTSDLCTRVYQHRNGEGSVFTIRYQCHDLVYFEYFESIIDAIDREKQLKKWKRVWKEELIKKMNPEMKNLSGELGNHL